MSTSATGRAATIATTSAGTATVDIATAYATVSDESRAGVAGARKPWQQGDPERICGEREHNEHAVRGEEAIGLRGTAELTRDDHADDGREAGLHPERERSDGSRGQGAQAGRRGTLLHRRGSVERASLDSMANDTIWSEGDLAGLRQEFADVYGGRTVLVTGADGFMGSHLTDALVALGANVHAFVRATSSGALNNIGHLRNDLKVHFADLTDRTSIDYLVRELREAPDRPYIFHLGAQAHVGESWHRPYETVMANTVGSHPAR